MSVSNVVTGTYVPEISGLININSVNNPVVKYVRNGKITQYFFTADVTDASAGICSLTVDFPLETFTGQGDLVAMGVKPQTGTVAAIQVIPNAPNIAVLLYTAAAAIDSQISVMFTTML